MKSDGSELNLRQQDLLLAAIHCGALKFSALGSDGGGFTLKSGRKSPYFLNTGLIDEGKILSLLAKCYADLIAERKLSFDVLFGPAYKGIPLAAIVSVALSQDHGRNRGVAYNRKEVKDHGEGGDLIGSSLNGKRVLIVDDVITAGTATRESIDFIRKHGGEPMGLITLLDRQERGVDTELSAVQQIRHEYDIPVLRVFTFFHLVEFIRINSTLFDPKLIDDMLAYSGEYGVRD